MLIMIQIPCQSKEVFVTSLRKFVDSTIRNPTSSIVISKVGIVPTMVAKFWRIARTKVNHLV